LEIKGTTRGEVLLIGRVCVPGKEKLRQVRDNPGGKEERPSPTERNRPDSIWNVPKNKRFVKKQRGKGWRVEARLSEGNTGQEPSPFVGKKKMSFWAGKKKEGVPPKTGQTRN